MDGNEGLEAFSACRADSDGWAAVEANILTPKWVSNAAASLQISFGMAGVMAWGIHAVGVELYLHYTKAEAERLAQVSLRRQGRSAGIEGTDMDDKSADV